MVYDLQTMGKRGFLVKSKKDGNLFKPRAGYIITDSDDIEFQIAFVSYDIDAAKWKGENFGGDRDMNFSLTTKTFRVFKEV